MTTEDTSNTAPEIYRTTSTLDNVANELAGIRRVLEHIAEQLDGWSSNRDHALRVEPTAGEDGE